MIPVAHTKNMSRSEWLAFRRKGLGGSDIAAILGLSPWSTPLTVYMEKLFDVGEREETDVMYWGNTLEPVVADEFAKRTGLPVKPLNFILQDDDYPFMLANIDRVIECPERGKGILECKTTGAYQASKWADDQVPDHYFYQVTWYLAVTGYAFAYIAVLIGGNDFRYKLIERDETLIAYLREKATDFWHTHILEENPPQVSAGDRETLNALYPASESATYDMHVDELPLFDALLYSRKKLREAEESADYVRNEIMHMMGFCDTLVSPAGERLATWKTNVKGSRVFKLHVSEADE